MKSWRLSIPALLALAAGGCAPGQHHAEVSVLVNENRDLEDNLYQQQAALKDLCQQLDACRKENQALRSQLPGSSPSGPGSAAQRSRVPATEAIEPSIQLPAGTAQFSPAKQPRHERSPEGFRGGNAAGERGPALALPAAQYPGAGRGEESPARRFQLC